MNLCAFCLKKERKQRKIKTIYKKTQKINAKIKNKTQNYKKAKDRRSPSVPCVRYFAICYHISARASKGRLFCYQWLQQQQKTITIARMIIQVQLSSKMWQRQLLFIKSLRVVFGRFYSAQYHIMPKVKKCYCERKNYEKSNTTLPSLRMRAASNLLPVLEMKPVSFAVFPSARRRLASFIGISRLQMVTPILKSHPSLKP